MKKFYLLLILLFFTMQQLAAQTVETFEGATNDLPNFTSNGKTFNLTSSYVNFKVYTLAGLGYNNSNKFLQVQDSPGPEAMGQTATITAATGNIKVNSLWLFVTGNAAYTPGGTSNSLPGSITFRGKLAGVTQFTLIKNTTGANTPNVSPANGFIPINFSTDGASDYTNINIDQLEIQLSSNYDYIAVDNFTWVDGVALPTVTTTTATNVGSVKATVAGNVTSNGGDNTVQRGIVWATTPNPTIASNKFQIGTGAGSFTNTITGLTAGSTIYYKAYATNSAGTTYGSESTFNTSAALGTAATGSTNVSCNGGNNGSAMVIANGGITPYSYSWSPSGGSAATASGLVANSYTVTITDGESTQITRTFSVTQPSAINTSAGSQTNVSCFGGTNGSASVTPTGGTFPYSYSWSPSGGNGATASGLLAGTYIVTVTDANICQATKTFIIGQPTAALDGSTVVTNVSCFGGSNGAINLTPSGGTGPYTFNWGGGITTEDRTGLTAGTYSVTITDANSCTKMINTITVGQPIAAVGGTTIVTNVSCFAGSNGAINLTPSGGTAPYTFNWGGGITTEDRTGLVAGTYSVTITDTNGCTGTVSNIAVGQPAAAVGGTTVVTNIACFGGSTGAINLTPSGGTGPYTFNWGGGITTEDRTGLAAGTYSVTITDNNGCTGTVSNIAVGQPAAALDGATVVTNVSCFGVSNGAINLTPSGGTGPYTFNWGGGITTEDRTLLAGGTYSVTITDNNGCTKTINNITVGQPAAALVASVGSQTNVPCNGGSNGSATVSATGGTPGYTYSWSPAGGTAATASGLTTGTYTATVTDANGCTATQSFTITEPATVLSASPVSQTNIACNGDATGSATVSAAGGTPGYTYAWTPSGGIAATASGLTAGTYTATVTDANGCTATQIFTINEPAALVASMGSQTNISCNAGATGSATVSVAGGTGAYTYAWSPSGGTAATASGLTAGTYTATVTDANGCSSAQSFTITEPAALVASVGSQTNVSCNGGSNGAATVTVTGGTGAYTYAWTPAGGNAATASGLTAGTYTVTITDANTCTTTQSFTITEPTNALVASVGSQTNVSCNGGTNGSATVSATGGTLGYTYSWSPTGGSAATASGLTAGTYIATVTDANGCSSAQSFTITEPATALSASPVSQTNIACNGDATGSATVSAAGGTPGYTYAWTPSGGIAATASGLTAGTYTATVTDANGCAATQIFTINEPTALVASIGSQTNISCNAGATGSATVSVTGGTPGYTYSWAPSGGNAATASGLSAGTYTVTVTDANSCNTTQSFTITEPAALVASVGTQTNVSCNGGTNGSATVTVTGGTGAYTYAWSPTGGNADTATGLAAGTYTVSITDANSCATTVSVQIQEPAVLAASIATQTNISCSGLSDGAIAVDVTGGTTPYTYSWSNGSATKDINGLAAGTYTLTVTDANGCSATQSVTLITTPDVTAPVPNVATLPVITNFCAVLSTEIAVPTATDTCSGSIAATTTDPLSYNAPGTYTITWTYTDASGNASSQTQTIKVLNSALDQVTFSNATVIYDKNPHAIQVANLPAGATVSYSITPSGSGNSATNAGTYTVTALVTPSASTPNCSPVTLTAQLIIQKAAQQITFGLLGTKTLGGANTFNLAAIASSGLPISYTFSYKTALPPATVAPLTGVVSMLRPGELVIVAAQAGDSNYLPALEVSQLLVIKNNDITVTQATIGTKVYPNPAKTLNYVMGCDENNVNVALANTSNATFTPSANFTVNTPKPGIYTQNVTVTSEDGSTSATYAITVEKPFGFFDIVKQKFNNVLIINNNPLTNGGYEFVSYQWFKNGQVVGTGQYYSAGDALSSTLDLNADYSVKMTTKDGKVLQTCSAKITLQNSLQVKLYPNPVQTGKMLTVDADFPQSDLDNMQISLYSVSGKLITTVKSSTAQTQIQLPPSTESNMVLVVLESGDIKKSFKVIVK